MKRTGESLFNHLLTLSRIQTSNNAHGHFLKRLLTRQNRLLVEAQLFDHVDTWSRSHRAMTWWSRREPTRSPLRQRPLSNAVVIRFLLALSLFFSHSLSRYFFFQSFSSPENSRLDTRRPEQKENGQGTRERKWEENLERMSRWVESINENEDVNVIVSILWRRDNRSIGRNTTHTAHRSMINVMTEWQCLCQGALLVRLTNKGQVLNHFQMQIQSERKGRARKIEQGL